MTGPRPIAAMPRSLDEALAVRATEPDRIVVQGGTDVMVAVNDGRDHPMAWLSLRGVDELSGLWQTGQVLTIGAGTTFHHLQGAVAEMAPALAMAARTIGSPQIRRAGTIGGNVVTGSPAADSVPALLCYDADVELATTAGVRRVPLAEFTTGPKATVLAPDELLTGLHLTSLGGVEWFAKVGPRSAMAISVCSLAARLDPAAGVARVAIGSVASTVRRVTEAEDLLLEAGASAAFADAVAAGADPIDDVRATAAYRRHALRVVAERVHRRLWGDVAGSAA